MADQRIAYTEEMVGSGHPSKTDTLNRLALIEHNSDGTHKYDITGLPYVDVRAYGAKGDGTTDDTAAIQAAISAVPNGGRVLFPYGTYLCASQVVSGTTMPEGITFLAVSNKGNDAADGTVIKYTGTDICFDIRFPNGTAEVGQWEFNGFTFQCTQGAAGMFQFNNISIAPTDDATTPYYIREVAFKKCVFWGGHAGASQTGNAIQAVKTFELTTDKHCQFKGWNRGVYLKGCDNNTIEGRFILNARHIHIERGGTNFGNANRISARFLGPCVTSGAETAYQVYDAAHSTTISDPWLEGGTPGMLYLDGQATVVYRPFFSASSGSTPNNVVVKCGANMVDVVIYAPQTTNGTGFIISYDTPSSWSWSLGVNEQLGKLIIINPSKRFEKNIITPHPRLTVVSEFNHLQEQSYVGYPSSNGLSLRNIAVTPFTIERCQPAGGLNFIADVVADSGGHAGYAIQLGVGNVTNTSCLLRLVVGTDISEGEVLNLNVRYKQSGVPGVGTTRYIIQKNSVTQANGALTNRTAYGTDVKAYTVSGFSAGDNLTIGVYNTSDVTVNIGHMNVTVTQVANADTSGATLAALETEVNELKAVLRATGIISV